MDALAVLDVGTTSTRAFVLRLDGTIISEAREPNRLETAGPDRAEHDPAALLAAAEMVVARVVGAARAARAAVRGLVISTQMHSLLLADGDGRPTTPVITWADRRADGQARSVRSQTDWQALYRRTGCPPHASYPLYKLMALRATGDGPRRADRVADIKSFLLWNWTGRWLIDLSLASASGLLDLRSLDWDGPALELAGIVPRQLPTLVDTTFRASISTSRLGLPVGSPVIVGAADGVLASLGCGAHHPGIASVTVGTSGAVRVGSPLPVTDPHGRLFSCYLSEEHWIVGGALSNGGLVLEWLGRIVGLDAQGVLDAAATVPAGAAGMVMIPLLAGERAPGYDGRARGAWFGLGLEHDRRHLARSAIEGIACRVRSVMEATEEAGLTIADVRATGGLAASSLWPRVLAGVTGREIGVPRQVEGSTLGALILGGVALGLLPDLGSADTIVRMGPSVAPDPADRSVYDATYALYSRLYRGLAREAAALATLRR
ncbi:MAG: gluconokinase [Chloroflexi bacterium]|nr:gluconokinase [Chloroflexota bacterium]